MLENTKNRVFPLGRADRATQPILLLAAPAVIPIAKSSKRMLIFNDFLELCTTLTNEELTGPNNRHNGT